MKRSTKAPPHLPRHNFVDRLLDRYRTTPGTVGRVRRNDRDIAYHLFERSVPLQLVEAAFDLAALRRLHRPPDALTLSPIRSLAYFLPVVEELLDSAPNTHYYRYLRHRLQLSQPPS